METSNFCNYLSRALAGETQSRAGARIGLSQPVLNRLLSGEQQPNYEHVIKLAVFLEIHPARLFELAGREKDATVCRALMPEEQGDEDLCRRVRKLSQRGLGRKVEEALNRVEFLWEVARGAFEQLMEEMGCESACLVADHLVKGDVLYRWRCSQEQARHLAEKRHALGWQRFTYSSSEVGLDLFIQGGEVSKTRIRVSLTSWASGLQLALSQDAAP